MITGALTAFTVSVFVFILLLLIVRSERRRGRRFLASGLRGWLDRQISWIGNWVTKTWNHFIKYILQLNWYYSIHSVLKATLSIIVAFYTYFENKFERNRARTKLLRTEKRQLSEYNHLHQMTTHRKDTALSASEQKKLRKKKLEEKH